MTIIMLYVYCNRIDEDEALARAIAASLNDDDQPTPKPKSNSTVSDMSMCMFHSLGSRPPPFRARFNYAQAANIRKPWKAWA